MADKNVHGGHRKRLRDRAMLEGLDNFNPHQILELLLFYAIPRQDTSEIAHCLIDKFGTVYDALTAPQSELVQVPGVGPKVAQWLRSLGSLVTAYGDLRASDRPQILNFRSAIAFCEEKRGKCMPGSVYQICTTPSGTIQIYSHICDSLSWGEPGMLRKSIQQALSVKARSVIIVEFVDQAQPKAEEYDRRSAEKYAYTLCAVGAELLDVILVGQEGVLSMNRSGDFDRTKFGEARSILAENYLREDSEIHPYEGDELPQVDHGL